MTIHFMNSHSAKASPRAVRLQSEHLDRRQRILGAAEEIFGSVAYHDASVTEIAQRAGFAAGTIYLYFKDKADLYGSLVVEKMEQLVRGVGDALKSSPSPKVCLQSAVHSLFAFHDRNRRFFEIFLHNHQIENSPLHRDHWEAMEALKKRNLSLFEDSIARGQDAGELRRGDAHLFAVVLLGITIQMVRQWLRDKKEGRIEESAEFAINCLFHGILA
jgi:AcrR family transcriptional regulator